MQRIYHGIVTNAFNGKRIIKRYIVLLLILVDLLTIQQNILL